MDDVQADLDDLLRELSGEIGQVYRWAAEQAGLNQTDLMSLYFIRNAEGSATPKAVASHLGLTSGATAILLNRLEARGLIARTPHPTDRRGVLLALGPAASEKGFLDLRSTIRRLNAPIINELSAEDAVVVKRFLQRLLTNTRDSLRQIRSGTTKGD